MDCNRCVEELTAFLDGELTASDSERVQSHVRTCVSCSEELRSLREIGEFVESHNPVLEPRPEAWNLVRARIYQESAAAPAPNRFFGRWRLAFAAIGLIAAFAVGYMQYEQIQQRNLDLYISQYMRERQTREINIPANSPDAYNPFIEVKASVMENPFRSEDR